MHASHTADESAFALKRIAIVFYVCAGLELIAASALVLLDDNRSLTPFDLMSSLLTVVYGAFLADRRSRALALFVVALHAYQVIDSGLESAGLVNVDEDGWPPWLAALDGVVLLVPAVLALVWCV